VEGLGFFPCDHVFALWLKKKTCLSSLFFPPGFGRALEGVFSFSPTGRQHPPPPTRGTSKKYSGWTTPPPGQQLAVGSGAPVWFFSRGGGLGLFFFVKKHPRGDRGGGGGVGGWFHNFRVLFSPLVRTQKHKTTQQKHHPPKVVRWGFFFWGVPPNHTPPPQNHPLNGNQKTRGGGWGALVCVVGFFCFGARGPTLFHMKTITTFFFENPPPHANKKLPFPIPVGVAPRVFEGVFPQKKTLFFVLPQPKIVLFSGLVTTPPPTPTPPNHLFFSTVEETPVFLSLFSLFFFFWPRGVGVWVRFFKVLFFWFFFWKAKNPKNKPTFSHFPPFFGKPPPTKTQTFGGLSPLFPDKKVMGVPQTPIFSVCLKGFKTTPPLNPPPFSDLGGGGGKGFSPPKPQCPNWGSTPTFFFFFFFFCQFPPPPNHVLVFLKANTKKTIFRGFGNLLVFLGG